MIIECRTKVCPLCHATFNKDVCETDEIRRLPRAFPRRSGTPFFANSFFDEVYLLMALTATLTALIAELIITGRVKWVFLVIGALLVFYILVRKIIVDTRYFSQKVLAQAVALTFFCILIQMYVYDEPTIIYQYALPIIYLVSMTAMAVYMLINIKNPRLHLVNLIVVALLAVLPAIIVYIVPDAHQNRTLALITAVLGGVIVATTLIFAAKKLWYELKRIFHI